MWFGDNVRCRVSGPICLWLGPEYCLLVASQSQALLNRVPPTSHCPQVNGWKVTRPIPNLCESVLVLNKQNRPWGASGQIKVPSSVDHAYVPKRGPQPMGPRLCSAVWRTDPLAQTLGVPWFLMKAIAPPLHVHVSGHGIQIAAVHTIPSPVTRRGARADGKENCYPLPSLAPKCHVQRPCPPPPPPQWPTSPKSPC